MVLHKFAEFSGLRIVHRNGRKMWCADPLSRRRTAEEDDQTPFEVEPGVLTKAELSSGVERVRLYQESDRKFYVRVVDGATYARQKWRRYVMMLWFSARAQRCRRICNSTCRTDRLYTTQIQSFRESGGAVGKKIGTSSDSMDCYGRKVRQTRSYVCRRERIGQKF